MPQHPHTTQETTDANATPVGAAYPIPPTVHRAGIALNPNAVPFICGVALTLGIVYVCSLFMHKGKN